MRRDHESPITWVPGAPGPAEEDDEMQEDPQRFDHNVPPAFVNDLSHRLARLGFDPDDADFEVPVRTWYLDHATVRRWTAPRNLQLVGPPQGWEMQFSSLWVDQIDPDEWYDLTIITPDPPRPYALRHFVLDLVITQSLDLPRFAGLVTIMPDARSRFYLYSVACSFDAHISGFDIINAADIARVCRHQACRITFGWQEIPNTLRPTHDTSHGDGFQIMIRDSPTQLGQRSESSSGSSATVALPDSRFHPQNAGTEAEAAIDSSAMTSSASASNASRSAARFMTALHLYQFQGQEVVMQLVNAQLVQPSHEMAEALNVPLDCLEAVYPIPCRPLDFPELAIPAIVQRTGDIPQRSTDRLILIDTKYLYLPNAEGQAPDPTVVRTVHRIGYLVIRSHLLMTAGVFHYCQLLEEQCTVSLDGIDWPRHDHGSRPVRHGSYVLIIVPPYSNLQIDTQVVAGTIQDDMEHDTFMNFIASPEPEQDDGSLCQLSSTTLKQRKGSRFFPHPVALAPAQDEAMQPEYHVCTEPFTSLGAVLRPKVDLNPQRVPDDAPPARKQQHRLTEVLAPAELQNKAADLQDQKPRKIKGKEVVRKDQTKPLQQSKIDAFFQPKSAAKMPATNGRKQTSITQFFSKPKAADRAENPLQEEDTFVPLRSMYNATSEQNHQCRKTKGLGEIRQNRCSDQQTTPAPDFQIPIPTQPPNGHPEPRPRPIWLIELTSLFDELATTRHAETGPEIEIDVWYVHHTRFPRCNAPRNVRLDNLFDLWYADICTVWFDHIVRNEPLKVLIVKPRPAHAMRSQAQTHVILEQGMTPGRVALHFTASFHGGNRNGIYQVAESVPDHICTNTMIELHNFWRFCVERPCHMWSGVLRFHRDQPEEIFSGMSALLDVHERPQHSGHASSSHALDPDDPDDTMLMQLPGTTHVASDSSEVDAPDRSLSDRDPNQDTHAGNNEIPVTDQPRIPQDQLPRMPSDSAPLLRIRDLALFRQALAWQVDQRPETRRHQATSALTVHTWFSDAVRLPRSDHYRAVMLGQLPMHWPFEILSRWQDWIDPTQEVVLQLVQPHPSGGTPDVAAHVLVIQAQHQTMNAALITVVELLEDPWHPTSFCTLLPPQVNAQVIMQEAGVTDRCRPLTAHQLCEIMHGSIRIEGDMTFPVRHGFQFELALSSLDEEWELEVSLLQLSFATIQQQIRTIDKAVLAARRSLPMQCPGSDASPNEQAISVTILPPFQQGTAACPFAYLTFHSVLQSAWQPLSLLSAQLHDPSVTVVTWFLDHIRYPQSFASIDVQLYHDPEEWLYIMERAWHDVILPDMPLHFHIVQPNPIQMEPEVAMHVLLVQQPVPNFDSVLISLVDSQFAGLPPRRHASMAPHLLPYTTLLGIAYQERECRHPQNTCSA